MQELWEDLTGGWRAAAAAKRCLQQILCPDGGGGPGFATWAAAKLAATGGEPQEESYWRDQLFDVLDASISTTSAALVAVLLLLFAPAHRDVLARVRAEVDALATEAVGPGPPRIRPRVRELSGDRLPILDAVLKESMRVLPPVTALSPRVLLGPGGEAVSSLLGIGPRSSGRCSVTANIWGMHRSEKHWDRAREFVPERWEAASGSARAFMPFGSGHHACLGLKFSPLELRLIVAEIVRGFDVQLLGAAAAGGHSRTAVAALEALFTTDFSEGILKPKGEIPVRFASRMPDSRAA